MAGGVAIHRNDDDEVSNGANGGGGRKWLKQWRH